MFLLADLLASSSMYQREPEMLTLREHELILSHACGNQVGWGLSPLTESVFPPMTSEHDSPDMSLVSREVVSLLKVPFPRQAFVMTR